METETNKTETQPNPKKLVKKKVIADRYDVDERTIQDWMKQGKIPFHKVDYLVRFDPEACDAALERFKVPARDPLTGLPIPDKVAPPARPSEPGLGGNSATPGNPPPHPPAQ